MEETLKLPTPDGKMIYGTFRGQYDQPTVVFVHGLTGSPLESKFYNGARYFEQRHISTVRFDCYSWEEQGRKLHTTTMKQHGEDISTICRYLQEQGVPKVIVVGHSIGALCALHADLSLVDHLIFWDGSYKIARFLRGDHIPAYNAVLIDCGFSAMISLDMIEEITDTNYLAILREYSGPVGLIYAGEGVLLEGMAAYLSASKRANTYIIEGAGHHFEEGETEKDLLHTTYREVRRVT